MAKFSLSRLKSLLNKGKRLGKRLPGISHYRRSVARKIKGIRKADRSLKAGDRFLLRLYFGKMADKWPNKKISRVARRRVAGSYGALAVGGLGGALGSRALIKRYKRNRRKK